MGKEGVIKTIEDYREEPEGEVKRDASESGWSRSDARTAPARGETVTSGGASEIRTGTSESLHWARPICIIEGANKVRASALFRFGVQQVRRPEAEPPLQKQV